MQAILEFLQKILKFLTDESVQFFSEILTLFQEALADGKLNYDDIDEIGAFVYARLDKKFKLNRDVALVKLAIEDTVRAIRSITKALKSKTS